MKQLSRKPGFLTDEFSSTANPSLLYTRSNITHLHECPVCGKGHRVNAARHAVSYGRQLTCSCDCEGQKRRRWRHS